MTLESRLKALEEEVARLRALLPSPPPPPPSPPSAAVVARDEGPEVPLEALTGYRVTLRMVCQAVAILSLWPFRPDGRIVLTREEASRVSALMSAYLNNGLSWGKALEAQGITPPPVEVSLSRLKDLGRLLQAARPVLGEAIAPRTSRRLSARWGEILPARGEALAQLLHPPRGQPPGFSLQARGQTRFAPPTFEKAIFRERAPPAK